MKETSASRHKPPGQSGSLTPDSALLSGFYKNSGWPIAALTPEGATIQAANKAFHTLLGATGPLNGAVMMSLVQADSRPLFLAKLTEIKKKGGSLDFQMTLNPSGGKPIPILAQLTAANEGPEQSQIIFFGAIDFSAQKQAELEVTESQWRMHQAQNIAHMGVWDWDAVTDQTVWSEEMFVIYGIDPASFTGKGADYFAFTHPDDRQMQMSNMARAFEKAKSLPGPVRRDSRINVDPQGFRLIRPNGQVRHVRGDAVAILAEDGSPARMVGILFDITDQVESQRKIIESEEKFRSIFDHAGFGIILSLLDGCIHVANKAMLNITGYTEDELKGVSLSALTHPEDWPREEKLLLELWRRERQEFEIEKRVFKKNGAVTWLRMMATLVRDADGAPKYSLGIIEDITRAKEIEAERQRLLNAVEQSDNEVIIYDKDGVILYVNGAFERTTGYERHEAVGKHSRALRSGLWDISLYKELWSVISSGQAWRGEFTNRRKNGAICQEEATITPIFDETHAVTGYVGIMRDVTGDRLFMKAKSFFVRATAHELRTPLTKLQLVESLLASTADKREENKELLQARDALRHVKTDIERIIGATSLLTQLTSGLKILKLPLQLRRTLELASGGTRVNMKMEKRNLTINSDFDTIPEKLTILGNEEMLRRAFEEVLSNAVKYTPDGREIFARAGIDGQSVVVEVTDQGIGLDPREQEKVFDPLFSLENVDEHSTSKYQFKGGGIGLGLTVARMIVEYHNGQIWIESKGSDHGAQVRITLPLTG
ncbi:MAG: PAS domain S-box protein [Nitrospinota bacterium]|nr:PAS domain S-box protein [Nitrospinota bacterium]